MRVIHEGQKVSMSRSWASQIMRSNHHKRSRTTTDGGALLYQGRGQLERRRTRSAGLNRVVQEQGNVTLPTARDFIADAPKDR
jgi:hypothetical protein